MKSGPGASFRMLWMRCQFALGPAGLAGIALLVAALAWAVAVWRDQVVPASEPGRAGNAGGAAAVASGGASASTPGGEALLSAAPPSRWARPSEVPFVLSQIQQAVVSNGMAWSLADYKLSAETAGTAAVFEVRSSLKGTYPQLRNALTDLLERVPGLTIRELSIARPNADTAEVDCKLGLAIFMMKDPAPDASNRPLTGPLAPTPAASGGDVGVRRAEAPQ